MKSLTAMGGNINDAWRALMGILAEPLQFIRDLHLPQGFSVCELGDQYITGESKPYLAVEFYKRLGCKKYLCIDGNGRGNVTADLNKPLDPELGQFDLVTDFGTGEHIFNQLQVFKTLHHLTKSGGYIVFDRPSQGYDGHCFYLVQWNLIAAIAHANWYEIIRLEEHESSRGILLRGVLKKRNEASFKIPQQGRYHKDLVIDIKNQRRGPDWKNQELRKAGVWNKPKAGDDHE